MDENLARPTDIPQQAAMTQWTSRAAIQWHKIHWSLRTALVFFFLVGLGELALSLAGVPAESAITLLIFLLPVIAGIVIALARPEPVIGWMEKALNSCAERRDRAAAKDTKTARWFFRPLYAALYLAGAGTRFIRDPFLRCGVTLAIQLYLICFALFVAYIAIVVIVALAFLLFALWIWSKFTGDNEGPVSSRERRASFRPARSEPRTDFLGNKYVQHLDENGRKIARTETKHDFLGNAYQETVSQDGERLGRSEAREGIFGDKYTQHFDAEGKKAGRSEQREGFLGNEYVQDYDEEGRKAGRSEVKEDFLGSKYVKHTPEP